MSRLRSLQSPSPATSPSRQASPTPKSSLIPFPQDTTTYHRKLRALIMEIKMTMGNWDEECTEGFDNAKGLVDEGTEMDNTLALPESPTRPNISSHREAYIIYQTALQQVLQRLTKLLNKLRLLITTADFLLFEAIKLKGIEFVMIDVLWMDGGTWTMEHFVESLHPLPLIHATHLSQLTHLSSLLQYPLFSLPNPASSHPDEPLPYDRQAIFESQKKALEDWQDLITVGGEEGKGERERWRREWWELVMGEMGGWKDDD